MWEKITQSLFKKNSALLTPIASILFVDDNDLQRKLISRILTKRNYRVLLSENGEQGLAIAKAEKPDLILLDIVLPGINGIEVCKRLKNDPTTSNIPVLFFTGSDTPQNILDCYEFGAENYLNKSISAGALISQIEMTLKESELSAET